ncbi:trypco2 family protein [Rhizobium puerariae]|uniref:Trypco2 family protein n=1 Tax=Rhizobium puerariae TaxID=1585791 RepID=A0ABV6ALD2_9HYPH
MALQAILNAVPVVVVLAIAGFVAWYVLGRAGKPMPVVEQFPLESTIGEIKAQLRNLEEGGGVGSGLELKEIGIELLVQQETKQTGEAGVKEIKVPVFQKPKIDASASFGRTETGASKVTLTLAPDFPQTDGEAFAGQRIEFAALLIAVREALKAGVNVPPRLGVKALEVELSFVLVRSTGAKGKIEVFMVSVGGEASLENRSSNKVTLKYEHPAASATRPA